MFEGDIEPNLLYLLFVSFVTNQCITFRLKDSKLSPAEMVALLELIEDRSRMDNSPYANNNLDFQNSPYELQGQEDNGEWWNSNAWEPSVQYYGSPYNNNIDVDSRYGGSNCK